MTRLHLFQRYSSKENVVTNNTLLLLSRLYLSSPARLEEVLASLFEADISIGVQMEQQKPGPDSVPDGMLVQEPLRVVVETKVGADFWHGQLRRHLSAFQRGQRNGYLLTISPSMLGAVLVERLERAVADHNEETGCEIIPKSTTFEELLQAVKGVMPEYDFELKEMVEDFEDYCSEMGLLPRTDYRMKAVPCGSSFDENMEFGVYYEPTSRSSREHEYLGIYKNKAIRGVGRVSKFVEGTIRDGDLHPSSGDPSDDEATRIVSIAKLARERHGWDLSEGHRFTVVDEFARTEFKKVSKGGMRGTQYFDLGEILSSDELPPVAEIAKALKTRSWE